MTSASGDAVLLGIRFKDKKEVPLEELQLKTRFNEE